MTVRSYVDSGDIRAARTLRKLEQDVERAEADLKIARAKLDREDFRWPQQ
jgi:hypothetical protein